MLGYKVITNYKKTVHQSIYPVIAQTIESQPFDSLGLNFIPFRSSTLLYFFEATYRVKNIYCVAEPMGAEPKLDGVALPTRVVSASLNHIVKKTLLDMIKV